MPDWFGDLASNVFLPNSEVMAYLIVFGEVAVGLGLIIGLFTRTAAFFGITMNLAFLLAGSTGGGISPLMVIAGMFVLTGAVAAVRVLSVDRIVQSQRSTHGGTRRGAVHAPDAWSRVPTA
ncbi:MAG: DoxX family protein [Thermoleophilia bacterium]|nr:DoxX family protein [Thermoleophilia bacterium]